MSLPPDLIKVAEAAIHEGAPKDFHRKVEIVAAALLAERDWCLSVIAELEEEYRRHLAWGDYHVPCQAIAAKIKAGRVA